MIASNSTNLESNIRARYLGLRPYSEVADLQNSILESVRNTKNVLIQGMEFQPVITLGVRGCTDSDLVHLDPIIPLVRTDRGGQATVHTPGQLVIYPTLDLKQHSLGVRDFVCLIVKATSAVLKSAGIESESGPAPGLYTKQGKIAFLGIRVDRGVVKHGLSINVDNDLGAFGSIKSCGIASARLDKMQNYRHGEAIDLNCVFQAWITAFSSELSEYSCDRNKLNSTCVKSFTIP